ncbi:MAG: hypothetical protein JXQ29_02425, partial [Planctomycetes bacterium]|nr:hypothetical protein [Planctomycetota bacterium]
VRIAYQLGDQAVEEDIYCVLSHHEIPAAGNQISQEVHRVIALRAAQGQLDAATPLLQFVANSPRPNLQWFNRYQQVSDFLVQMQLKQIEHAGKISDIISRTHNEISDMIMQSYRTRQAAEDRMARSFTLAFRGVDEYRVPGQDRTIELPTGYAAAFVNGRGEYLLAEKPGFNASAETGEDWTRLERNP